MRNDLFELSEQYEKMLRRGIRLSGEDQSFFIAGRLRDLERRLAPDGHPRRILDFGCGIGHTACQLAQAFPEAKIVGLDTSEKALAQAEAAYGSTRISFRPVGGFQADEAFDLCYTNGVFHHIAPSERLGVVRMIRRALVPGGRFALFENNPWHPGTRLVMSRIPFDRDAVALSPPETRRLLRAGGFDHCEPARFLFYFPRPLSVLRFIEPWLVRLPLGAQYYVLAVRKAPPANLGGWS